MSAWGNPIQFARNLRSDLTPATAPERELIEQLRDTFRALPVLDTDGVPDAEASWRRNMNILREHGLTKNPRRFLTWRVIRRTMFISKAGYLGIELDYLKSRPDWADRWQSAIQESPVGQPTVFRDYPQSSGNLIHHAYHVARFEETVGIPVNQMKTIVEFGGGYGSMCRLIRKLGFQGRYVVFDLPHFSALQRYFLQSIGLTVSAAENFATSQDGNYCVSDLDQLAEMLAPTPAQALFLATWSLSETPNHIRESFSPLIADFDTIFMAYQEQFEDEENVPYFRDWRERFANMGWHDFPIEHLPGNRYMFGHRTRP